MKGCARTAVALVAGACLAACARNPEPVAAPEPVASAGGDSGSPALTAAKGRVVNGGTDRVRITSLVSDGGTATRLVGALIHELRSLAGAELLVRGVTRDDGAGRALDVREYEVLSVDGQRPLVGIVIRQGDALWLAAGDTLRLVPQLDEMRALVNTKVWVVGETDPVMRELRIRSYGAIVQAR